MTEPTLHQAYRKAAAGRASPAPAFTALLSPRPANRARRAAWRERVWIASATTAAIVAAAALTLSLDHSDAPATPPDLLAFTETLARSDLLLMEPVRTIRTDALLYGEPVDTLGTDALLLDAAFTLEVPKERTPK